MILIQQGNKKGIQRWHDTIGIDKVMGIFQIFQYHFP